MRDPRGSTMPALRHAANPPVSLYLQAGLFALSALLSFVACPGRPWTTYSYTVFERRRVPTATRIASCVREPRARCVAHLIAGHSTRAAFRPPRELGLDPARAASRSFDRCAPCRGRGVILPHPPRQPPPEKVHAVVRAVWRFDRRRQLRLRSGERAELRGAERVDDAGRTRARTHRRRALRARGRDARAARAARDLARTRRRSRVRVRGERARSSFLAPRRRCLSLDRWTAATAAADASAARDGDNDGSPSAPLPRAAPRRPTPPLAEMLAAVCWSLDVEPTAIGDTAIDATPCDTYCRLALAAGVAGLLAAVATLALLGCCCCCRRCRNFPPHLRPPSFDATPPAVAAAARLTKGAREPQPPQHAVLRAATARDDDGTDGIELIRHI